jgi:thymidylate synthase
LNVEGYSIAEAWERSLFRLYHDGTNMPTQYDGADDAYSRDATMVMTIKDPMSEPMIHRDIPGGLEDLQEYVMEVVDGIKDHLVRDPNDPEDTRWEYTYHQRLFNYEMPASSAGCGFDQIETIARKLAASPFTRRAQAVTWKVWEDNDCYDPACLQSIWCRCVEEDGIWWMNTNVRFRSNDAYKAAMMNIFAITMLLQKIAYRLQELSGKTVKLGRYMHMADSYHIYGKDLPEFEGRFLRGLETRPFAQRTFRYEDVALIMEDAIPGIKEKVAKIQ